MLCCDTVFKKTLCILSFEALTRSQSVLLLKSQWTLVLVSHSRTLYSWPSPSGPGTRKLRVPLCPQIRNHKHFLTRVTPINSVKNKKIKNIINLLALSHTFLPEETGWKHCPQSPTFSRPLGRPLCFLEEALRGIPCSPEATAGVANLSHSSQFIPLNCIWPLQRQHEHD